MAYGNYVAQTWTDGSGGGTPISAARLAAMETGIFNAHYPPAARVYRAGAMTLTTAVDTVVTFDLERFDTAANAADTHHDNVTNNSRLTCRYAGIYQISGTVEFASNATGIRYLHIRLNGTTDIAAELTSAVSGTLNRMTISTLYQLAVNDYVEMLVQQTSGGNLALNATGNNSAEFMFARVA